MLKNLILFFVIISIILGVICSCSTNSLTSSPNNSITSTESKSDEEQIVVIPTTSAKDMTSQEVIDLVEEKVTKINLPDKFKFTSGEMEYIYNQSSLDAYQTVDFLFFGSLSVEQKNKFVEQLDTATWQNSGVQFEKFKSEKIYYYKTLEDKKNRVNEQIVENNDEEILVYHRNISYTTIYKYHTSLGIFIDIFKVGSDNYNIIIQGQIANENPIEGLLQIQPDGSAKAIG